MPKISVIMPVHNTGILLSESIGALEKQSMKDFELICVDDASSDILTVQTLDLYRYKCPFMKVVHLKNNVGAAEARNVGLDMALGEYVIFLDSDDEFSEVLLETMYGCAVQNSVDICCCGYEEFYEDEQGRHSLGIYFPKEQGTVTQGWFTLEDLDETALTLWTPAPWKLFRRAFVQENGIRFQTLPSSNDVYFSCMAAILARRICYTKCGSPLVFYRQNVDGQISSNRNPGNLLKAVKWLMEDLINRGMDVNSIKRKIAVFLYDHAVYELKVSRDEEQSRKFYDDLKYFTTEHEDEMLLFNYQYKYFRDSFLKQEYDSGWFLLVGDYRMQLERHAGGLVEELNGYQKIVLWGMGKRGEAFQYFCRMKNIDLIGIADRSNRNVGGYTEYGFKIVDKNCALTMGDMIVASNREIYWSLIDEHKGMRCIDLSRYCPY